jgi:hypothetical protein
MKWIYLIKAETELGEETYKIGITKREPKQRLKELQTANPADLSIIHIFETKIGNQVETTLHRTYGTSNVKGEWFSLTDEQLDSFLTNCFKIEENFVMLQEENSWYQEKVMKRFDN